MASYISYDDGSHYISCLQLVDEHLRTRSKDAANIRWIVLGLHDALYALLIEKLTRTDGFGIFKRELEDKVREFYDQGKDSNSEEFHELSESTFNQDVASLEGLLMRAFPTS